MKFGQFIVKRMTTYGHESLQGIFVVEPYEHSNRITPEKSYKVYLTPVGPNAEQYPRRAWYATDIFGFHGDCDKTIKCRTYQDALCIFMNYH